jgi:hypothetical protein
MRFAPLGAEILIFPFGLFFFLGKDFRFNLLEQLGETQ